MRANDARIQRRSVEIIQIIKKYNVQQYKKQEEEEEEEQVRENQSEISESE